MPGRKKRKRLIVIKSKYEAKGNEYEVKENIAYIKLRKKDGTIIDTKIDAADLKMVLDKGTWFAEWNKTFNSYLVQNVNYPSKEKQTLHSFILGAHAKSPIRHINGDTLDNRRCNIKVYNQNIGINDYEKLDAETIAIILRDKYGREKTRTMIDNEDLDKVLNSGYTWVYYTNHGRDYAISNSPEGRTYLHNFIMNTPENIITKHVNYDTLDNRKSNLNNIEIIEEVETTEDDNK
jgi:hypothetical protein